MHTNEHYDGKHKSSVFSFPFKAIGEENVM